MLRFFVANCLILIGNPFPVDDNLATQAPTIAVDTLPEVLAIETTPLGFSKLPEFPDDNPFDPEKIQLGRKLFFDPILSKDKTVACASCHRPESGFANSEKVAIGIGGKSGTRNVPTILNRAYGKHFTWDGRSATLEEQVLLPISNPNELGNEVEVVVAELRRNADYVASFSRVFGNSAEPSPEFVSAENLAKSIAAFERVLLYGNTKVDRFRASQYTALSREARQGMWIFESRGGCWKCHGGENFTDEDFHNTGVGFGDENRDLGRSEHSGDDNDSYKFKTPTLRGIAFTAPYMHDGRHATLKDVVEFYNKGGSVEDPGLDSDLKPLELTDEEVGYLVEFLKAASQ